MCLLVVAWQAHSRYRLVVAANRDEFHDRPTAPMAQWPEVSGRAREPGAEAAGAETSAAGAPASGAPGAGKLVASGSGSGAAAPSPHGILAGRDLRAHGTWLALDRHRRFGVVTNFRDLQRPQPHAPSRGGLIPQYLSEDTTPAGFLAALEGNAGAYAGFNLLLADSDSLWYATNRTQQDGQDTAASSADAAAAPDARSAASGLPTHQTFARALSPGVYGLSNQFLDTPWPKLRRVRREFEKWLAQPTGSTHELFAILEDRTLVAEDAQLPRTGLSREWERILSAPFVLHPDYGTRSSTVLLLEHSGAFVLIERRFDRQGGASGESQWSVNATGWP